MLHVELTDILAEVDKIMQKVDGVIDEPIIVEICKVRQGTLSWQNNLNVVSNVFAQQ